MGGTWLEVTAAVVVDSGVGAAPGSPASRPIAHCTPTAGGAVLFVVSWLVLLGIFSACLSRGTPAHLEQVPFFLHWGISFLLDHPNYFPPPLYPTCFPRVCISNSREPLESSSLSAVGGILEAANEYLIQQERRNHSVSEPF